MKRFPAALLAVLLTACFLGGCDTQTPSTPSPSGADSTAAPSKAVTVPVHIEGAVFGGQTDDSIEADLVFDAKWLTEGDNTVYHSELAAFSAILCADTYFREKDLAKGTQNRVLADGTDAAAYDRTALLKKIGFADAVYIETYKEKEYASDGNDSATMTLGYSDAEDGYDIFVVALRGCFSAQEWLSVFDSGFDGDDYVTYTGEHPEWTDKSCFKGVDIAANRAKEYIDAFIASHDDPARENRVLITGHSRGAALAELIGADMERTSDAKTFTYAFNAMPVTADPSAREIKTVFNVLDENDFYTNTLPFGEEAFYRFGTDLTGDIAVSDEVKTAIASLKGRDDYLSPDKESLALYRELFGGLFPDRASLYTAKTQTEVFDTEEQAASRKDELDKLIGAEEGLDLGVFCKTNDIAKTADGKYAVTTEYCGGALLIGFSKTLAYGEAAHDVFVSLFTTDETACRIADFLLDHLPAITGGHLLVNTYILSRYVE